MKHQRCLQFSSQPECSPHSEWQNSLMETSFMFENLVHLSLKKKVSKWGHCYEPSHWMRKPGTLLEIIPKELEKECWLDFHLNSHFIFWPEGCTVVSYLLLGFGGEKENNNVLYTDFIILVICFLFWILLAF